MVTVVACILAVCLVAALVLFSLVNSKVRALQKGATFEFSYNITAQSSSSTPALYNILKQVGATSGDVAGLYSPGQLQLYLYPSGGLARAETGGTDFFTDLYIDANDTYFDAGRLYRTLRDSIADSAPLVGAFLPEWSLPNYITQAQLAKILGVPNTQVAMQEMSGYTLTLSRQCIVHPDYAKKDYTYYQFPSEGEDAAVLVVGLPLKSLLFDDTIPWMSMWRSPPTVSTQPERHTESRCQQPFGSRQCHFGQRHRFHRPAPGASGAICRSHQHSVKACTVT